MIRNGNLLSTSSSRPEIDLRLLQNSQSLN